MSEDRWIVFGDESGAAISSVMRRTWGPRGCTPVVHLNGSRRGRVNMVGWLAYRPGHQPRLYAWYKPGKGYTKEDFPLLLTALKVRFGGKITLVWDNHSSHLAHNVTEWTEGERAWLDIVQLPAYAPGLNPVELLWKIVKDEIANRAFRSITELGDAIATALGRLKRRADLIIGFLLGTGLEAAHIVSSR
ncbi:IS630 family transposase [Streptomyces sp. NPDC054884]|uniref:IS630 family transposase n=1 Tax=unclassified Streptomyces TaxID=2593676 RepID=UPI0029A6EB13|nr:IS630 family transposase [Streptomyces sp. ME08-AFT2]MDX3312068.1 IS630 family transposase [Streptomyces sp. ME08-AFT2]